MARSEQQNRSGDSKAGSVWLQPVETRRRDPLTRQRIVAAALELLDSEGARALTVRRLADRLEVGPATLYGHVRTKEDVLDLAVDAVYAEIEADGSGDWRTQATALLHAWRTALLRHPWSASVLGRPQLGPHMLAREERLYALLSEGGLQPPHLQDAAYALSNYVIGSLLMQVAWQEQDTATQSAAAEHIAANRASYPVLAAHRCAPDTDWDRSFASGLHALLDGVAPAP